MAHKSIAVARFFGAAAIFIFTLAALGTLVPALPLISSFGPELLARLGSWVILLSLLGVLFYGRDWRRHRRRRALAFAGMAGFAAMGITYVQLRQIGIARAAGVKIDIGKTLWYTAGPGSDAQPESFVYDTHGGLPLGVDVYRAANAIAGKPSPVLVYIHGGGWVAGSDKQRQADLRWFAAQGYVVVSLDYSLSSEKQHFWDTTLPELGCGLAWIAGNAGKIGADPSRLALFGESAGGNLVLNVSYAANQGNLHPACAGTMPHVAATIAAYPVVDAARAYRNPDLTVGRFAKSMAMDYTGGAPEEFPDRYLYVSSAAHISPAAPPTLLIVPDGDTLVAPDASYEFAAQASKAGIDLRLIRVPFAQHGFDLAQGGIGNQLVRQATLSFLGSHGLRP